MKQNHTYFRFITIRQLRTPTQPRQLSHMYTAPSDSEFGFSSKKSVDLDANFVSWLMAEEGSGQSPYQFPSGEVGSGAYSFESFPQEVPPLGSEFPMQYEGFYTNAMRRPVDGFGFPTELQLPGYVPQRPEETQNFQSSTEHSSNRKSTNPPSTAQVKNRKAQKKFRERQKVENWKVCLWIEGVV